jgi:hypothetical protein
LRNTFSAFSFSRRDMGVLPGFWNANSLNLNAVLRSYMLTATCCRRNRPLLDSVSFQ